MNEKHEVWATFTTETYGHLLECLSGIEADCDSNEHLRYLGDMAAAIKTAIAYNDVKGIAQFIQSTRTQVKTLDARKWKLNP